MKPHLSSKTHASCVSRPTSIRTFRCDRTAPEQGFTRVEMLAAIVALSLLAIVAFPMLANTSNRSDRVACLNNLRIIGRALQSWGQDHGDRTPWNTPYCEGGTRNSSLNPCNESPPGAIPALQNNLWFQYVWLSNELVSPKYLADPADGRVRAAQDWSNNPNTGFLHASSRGIAISYFIGLHASSDFPESALSGDRNLQSELSQSCSLGLAPVATVRAFPNQARWLNGPHGFNGNVLRYDGVVEQTDDAALYRRIFPAGSVDDNGSQHFMLPQ